MLQHKMLAVFPEQQVRYPRATSHPSQLAPFSLPISAQSNCSISHPIWIMARGTSPGEALKGLIQTPVRPPGLSPSPTLPGQAWLLQPYGAPCSLQRPNQRAPLPRQFQISALLAG